MELKMSKDEISNVAEAVVTVASIGTAIAGVVAAIIGAANDNSALMQTGLKIAGGGLAGAASVEAVRALQNLSDFDREDVFMDADQTCSLDEL